MSTCLILIRSFLELTPPAEKKSRTIYFAFQSPSCDYFLALLPISNDAASDDDLGSSVSADNFGVSTLVSFCGL